MKNGESKATVTAIKCTSRVSTKIKDTFYTVEYGEERSIPEDADIELERKIMWDDCNTEVDNQIADIIENITR